MKPVIRRLARLEDQFAPADHRPRKVFRIVVRRAGSKLSPDKTKCTRTLCRDGSLFEVVRLDRCPEGSHRLTYEALKQFVASCPVQKLGTGIAI